MAVVAYVSVVCPFLVPVGPHVQGELVTTRLLPPLSAGVVTRPIESPAGNVPARGVERMFWRANRRLLEDPVVMKSGTGPGKVGSRDTGTEESSIVFLLGTDDLGRDVWSRVIYGTRVSLLIGTLAAIGAVLIGTSVGFSAGMSGRYVDLLLMRSTDMFLAIPGLFLVVAIMAFVGESVFTIILALAVTGWMSIARLIRGEVVRLREREYILAARMLQVSRAGIVLRHMFPNLRFIVVTAFVLQFGNAVLAETALSFLGLGVQPPTASWGNMMGQAMGYLESGWWVGFFPGCLLATVIVSAHLIGEPEYAGLSRRLSMKATE
jgi:peptide/nickel transport system permease protein